MPGWHARTKDLVEAGKLSVLGIAEEQHPDRMVLFMQWKEMDWPVMLDSMNLMGVKGIPHTYLIDEHGVIRFRNPKPADLDRFLATEYDEPRDLESVKMGYGIKNPEGVFLWKGESVLDSVIENLQRSAAIEPPMAEKRFRLGVAYRRRFDSPMRREGDFTRAVEAWTDALALDPNQYIWRRRIQQYGPRLDKPYSFYDWVPQARRDLEARGEAPHPLAVEPSGSEFATPQKEAEADSPADHPDPHGKVLTDIAGLVRSEVTAVPSTRGNREAYRVHLRFSPDRARKVHWSNDAGPLSFFTETGKSIKIVNRQGPADLPAKLETTEERVVEFEVRPAGADPLPKRIRGAAFYFVCEDVGGKCLYLRRNLEIELGE